MSLPEALNYSTVRPPGIPSRITTIRYNPTTSTQAINPGDIVRFDINANGFWDPYNTFINLDVSFENLEDNVIAQIDKSAQSFFRYMVIYNRGTEIERIMEYDILAAIMQDVQIPTHQRLSRMEQGMGVAFFPNITFGKIEGGLGYKTTKTTLFTPYALGALTDKNFPDATTTQYALATSHTDSTFKVLNLTDLASAPGQPVTSTSLGNEALAYLRYPILKASETHLYSGEFDPIVYNADSAFNTYLTNNVVKLQETSFAETLVASLNKYAPDASKDYRITCISELSGVDETFGPGKNVGKNIYRQNGFYGIDVITDADVIGGGTWKQCFNASLSNGNWEPQFTNGKSAYYNPAAGNPTEASIVFYLPGKQPSGWVLAPDQLQYAAPLLTAGQFTRNPRNTGSFSFPLLSGLFGVLMPSASYRLIPMTAFPNLTFEFQISPWAVFTSGYCNTNTNSQYNQPERRFLITRLEFVTCQYLFPADVEAIVSANYRAGQTLYFHSHSFVLGPTTNVPQNQVPGDVQINMGFDSLKALLWCFIPLDYQQWSWCRRQYRLSMNVIKVQIKMGSEYYPSIPALANGGNVAPLAQNVNFLWRRPNNEYVIELYKCFGIYNNMTKTCYINPVNFAVNNRCYAPDNTLASSNAAPDRMGYAYQENFCQYGSPLRSENACVGTAVYSSDLESLTGDSKVLSGVNTMGIKPFDIIQEYQGDSNSNFKGQATMYVFCWYDFLVAVNLNGIAIVGRA